MMQLHYFFIYRYKAIQNVGIRLNGRFEYEMDPDRKVLRVRENEKWADNFWPEGVSSLTALVGSNGSGKTTFMEAILQMVEKGNNWQDVDAMVIYQVDKQFCVYKPKGKECEIEGLECEPMNNPPKVELFYYSSYFHPDLSIDNPRTGELDGVYNASDTWRMVKDLLDYSNSDTITRARGLSHHMDAMKAQDGNRIVQLLADKGLRSYLPKNALPEFVLINPNHSGYEYFITQPHDKFTIIDEYGMASPGSQEHSLARIVYSCFTNIAAQYEAIRDAVFDKQTEWSRLYKQEKNVSTALRKLNTKDNVTKVYVRQLIKLVSFLRRNFKYDQTNGTLYLELKSAKEATIKQLLEYFRDENFIVAHYFDLAFSRDKSDTMQLSSGEYDLLKLFSRIYDAVILTPDKFSKTEKPALVLLDEAENSYHPEWQRMFVKMLTDFLSALYLSRNDVPEFQVILTTHSPILLSDIPVACTNYLRREGGGGKIILHKVDDETFGSNIFNLYKDSFFMENGLMGQYAYDWIESLRGEIVAKEEWTDDEADGLIQKIEQIGDEIIRRYLLMLLEQRNEQSAIKYYRGKIKELEGKEDAKNQSK